MSFCVADDVLTEEQHEMVESAAEMLYGLIHVRYILTTRGLSVMVRELGTVPLHDVRFVYAPWHSVVPYGLVPCM